MAKKAKTKTETRRPRITEWSPGKPLAFPKKKNSTDVNLLAGSVVEAARGESLPSTNPTEKRSRKK
jgi:hypothetical protein